MTTRRRSPANRAAARSPRRERGYTAVEILAAMTLFAIGAAGVISMQRVTIQGGEDARHFDTANNIAHEWLARLQRDAMYWTQPSSQNPATENLFTNTNTRWIKDVGASGMTAYKTPTIPPATKERGFSPAFDILGRDRAQGSMTNGQPDHYYCVQYKLNWVAKLGTAPNLNVSSLMRADVRVFWSRLDQSPIGDCSDPPVAPDAAAAAGRYHFVYATTAIRENADR